MFVLIFCLPAPAINNSSQSINVTKSKRREPATVVWKVRTRHLVKRSAAVVHPASGERMIRPLMATHRHRVRSEVALILLVCSTGGWSLRFHGTASLSDCLLLKKIFIPIITRPWNAANKRHLFKKTMFLSLYIVYFPCLPSCTVSFLLMNHYTLQQRMNC